MESLYDKLLKLFGKVNPWVLTEEEQKQAEKFADSMEKVEEEYRRKRIIPSDTLYYTKNSLSKYVPKPLNDSKPYGMFF